MSEINVKKLQARIFELEEKIKNLKNKKKYGLVWEDKKEDVIELCKSNIPIIKEIKSREITTNKNGPVNILIEGDNYHSLSILNYTHKGKIDVIYIDPPYNTGNKDFVYNDKIVDREDGYRHSKWLSFMQKRLVLAKELLSKNGIIFISIDDNEVFQLKLLCDSVFGSDNFINNFIWINNLKGRQIGDFGASKTYEYILCYGASAQDISAFEGNIEDLKKISPEIYKNKNYEIFEDEIGKYVLKNELYNSNSDFNEETRPNLVFDIFYNPKTKDIKFEISKKDRGYVHISPKENNNGVHKYHAYRWGKDKIARESYNLEFVEDDGEFKIYTKIRDIYTTTIKDVITNISTNAGGKEVKEIIGKKKFSFPKPLDLIAFLLSFSSGKDSIVLDFMAGSGTTGHAVLKLNSQDGGNRKFILCTNNENKICEDVTFERLKNVISGYKIKDGKINGLGGNLKYYKAGLIRKSFNRDEMKIRITEECTEMLCIREGVYEEVKNKSAYRIFKQGEKVLAIYYFLSQKELPNLKKDLDKMGGEKILYCFTLDNLGLNESDFDSWRDVRLEAIPEKILDIYKEINEY